MCAMEKIRMRNIAERQNKFEEFKLANLVSTVSLAYKTKKTNPKKSAKEIVHSDDEFESYAQPSTSRVLPKRNCNQIISYEDKNSSDSDDEPKKEANWNESTKISDQNEVNDESTEDETDEEEIENNGEFNWSYIDFEEMYNDENQMKKIMEYDEECRNSKFLVVETPIASPDQIETSDEEYEVETPIDSPTPDQIKSSDEDYEEQLYALGYL